MNHRTNHMRATVLEQTCYVLFAAYLTTRNVSIKAGVLRHQKYNRLKE